MADRYWVAASNSTWNSTSNWSTSSGGGSGASVPSTSDTAIFDSGSTNNCTVDVAVDVDNISITSGYSGTFSTANFQCDVATNFTTNLPSGGSCLFGSSTMNVDGDVTLAGVGGASFNMGSSTWNIQGSWDQTGALSTSFTQGTYTIVAQGSGTLEAHTSSFSRAFKNITISGTYSSTNLFRIQNGLLNIQSGGSFALNPAAAQIQGDIDVDLGGTFSGSTNINFSNGTGSITNDGTWTHTGTISVERSVTINGGTYDSAFSFNAGNTSNNSITFSGNVTFNGQVVILKDTASGSYTVANGTNNPNLTFNNDFTILEVLGSVTWTKGSGTITIGGAGSDAINFLDKTIEDIEFTAGTKTLTNGFICDSFTLSGGTVDVDSETITVDDSTGGSGDMILTGGTLDLGTSATLDIDGDFTIGTSADFTAAGLNGSTINVGGNMSATGPLDWEATASWDLNVTGTAEAFNVTVAYSDASGGSEVIADSASTDADNNVNWTFETASGGVPGLDNGFFRRRRTALTKSLSINAIGVHDQWVYDRPGPLKRLF